MTQTTTTPTTEARPRCADCGEHTPALRLPWYLEAELRAGDLSRPRCWLHAFEAACLTGGRMARQHDAPLPPARPLTSAQPYAVYGVRTGASDVAFDDRPIGYETLGASYRACIGYDDEAAA